MAPLLQHMELVQLSWVSHVPSHLPERPAPALPGQGWQSGPRPCCCWLQPPSPQPATHRWQWEHGTSASPSAHLLLNQSLRSALPFLGAETREWGQEQTQLTAGACLLQVLLEELHLGRNTNGKGNALKENTGHMLSLTSTQGTWARVTVGSQPSLFTNST